MVADVGLAAAGFAGAGLAAAGLVTWVFATVDEGFSAAGLVT